MTQEGPQALLERPGLALLGGLLLAGALVLCSVDRAVAAAAAGRRRRAARRSPSPSSPPALAGLRDAVASDDLEWTVPGAGLLVTGLGFAGLTVLAWRLRRRPR